MILETGTKPTDEFNFSAAPSAELKRKLLYLAASGDAAVFSAFGATGKWGGRTPEERRRHEAQEFDDLVHLVLASQECIERFNTELNEFEDRRTTLLAKTEEDLRQAHERVQRLRDAAPEIDFSDGTKRKVFRDGGNVRDETGTLVSSEIVKPEAVSNNPLQWSEFSDTLNREKALAARRDRLQTLGEKMKDAKGRANDGKMSDKDMDEFKDGLDKALAAEEQPLAADAGPALRDKTFQTAVNPTADFTSTVLAASPVADKPKMDKEPAVRRPSADASTPAIP